MINARRKQVVDLIRVGIITYFVFLALSVLSMAIAIPAWCLLMSAFLKCVPVPAVVWKIVFVAVGVGTFFLLWTLIRSTRTRKSDPCRYSPRIIRKLILQDGQVSEGIKKEISPFLKVTNNQFSKDIFLWAACGTIDGPPELAQFAKRRLFRIQGKRKEGAWDVMVECRPCHWIIYVDPTGLSAKGMDQLLKTLNWSQTALEPQVEP